MPSMMAVTSNTAEIRYESISGAVITHTKRDLWEGKMW